MALLFVNGAKPFLDDERAESNTAWKGGAAHPCACKTFGVALFNHCPRHEAGQLPSKIWFSRGMAVDSNSKN